jgi:hypothetical protein
MVNPFNEYFVSLSPVTTRSDSFGMYPLSGFTAPPFQRFNNGRSERRRTARRAAAWSALVKRYW